ncbi:helix-turn-helix domain-containing protein [bacterium]|nr:helix-turn-helix domain-containing protein [bacterium]
MEAGGLDPTLGAALKKRLLELGGVREFERGEVLLEENAYIRSLPLVISGSIRVMRTDDEGREILLYYIQAGESCIMSFLGGLHRDRSRIRAVVDEAAEVLIVPSEHISSLVREQPEWLDYIFRLYQKRFEELLDAVNAVAFKRMDERLSDFLRRRSEVVKSKTLEITHEQIAQELGTARVVVSRLLKEMEHKNLLKLGRGKIELV